MWRGFEEGAIEARQKHHPWGHKQSLLKESQEAEWDFFSHQLSVKYNLILDLAIRNGNFFKAHGKSNNEKEIFLVLYLAQDSNDSKMGGACLVSGGGRPFLQNSLGPAAKPQGQGPVPGDPVVYPGSVGLLGSLAETRKGSCYVPVLFQASVSSWSCYSFTFLREKKKKKKS